MSLMVLKRLLFLAIASVVTGLDVATRGYRSSLKDLYAEGSDNGIDDFIQNEDGDTKPAFLRPSSTGEMTVVNFYVDRCEPCEAFKEHFINLADQVHHMTEEGHKDPAERTVTFLAVHCAKHPQLCKEEKVTKFPSVRAYGQNTVVELNTAKLHPYDVLQKLTFKLEKLVEDEDDTGDKSLDLGDRRKATGERIKTALGWIIDNELYEGEIASLPEGMRGLLRLWLAQLNRTLPQLKRFTADLLQRYKYLAKSKLYLAPILEEHGVENPSLDCEAVYDLFQSILVGSMEYSYLGFDQSEKLHPAMVTHTNYQFVKQYINVCDLQERFIQPYEACRDDTTCQYYSALHLPDDLQEEATEQDWKLATIWWARVVRPQPFPSKTACPTCTSDDSTSLLRFLRLEYGAFHSSVEDITPLSKEPSAFTIHHASLFLLVVLGLILRSGSRIMSSTKKRRRYTLTLAMDFDHSKGE